MLEHAVLARIPTGVYPDTVTSRTGGMQGQAGRLPRVSHSIDERVRLGSGRSGQSIHNVGVQCAVCNDPEWKEDRESKLEQPEEADMSGDIPLGNGAAVPA